MDPKAWIMTITGAGAFLSHFDNLHISVFIFAVTFGLGVFHA
jgi:hypothetical protein